MKRRLGQLFIVVLVMAHSVTVFAQQTKPETIIKWRQSAYQVIVWNMSRIKNSLEGPVFDREEITRSANVIATLANAGMGSLYAPGTETGYGWKETRVKPALFKNPQQATELAGNFSRESAEMFKLSPTADVSALRSQYTKLSKTCRACHDELKFKD
ncbi:MAG: putative cytochrome c [Pseudomonadota bacterium]|jgi:cytochrome c556